MSKPPLTALSATAIVLPATPPLPSPGNVPGALDPVVRTAGTNGATPSNPQRVPFDAPGPARCGNTTALRCDAHARPGFARLAATPHPPNTMSRPGACLDDGQGRRAGARTRYLVPAASRRRRATSSCTSRPKGAPTP